MQLAVSEAPKPVYSGLELHATGESLDGNFSSCSPSAVPRGFGGKKKLDDVRVAETFFFLGTSAPTHAKKQNEKREEKAALAGPCTSCGVFVQLALGRAAATDWGPAASFCTAPGSGTPIWPFFTKL